MSASAGQPGQISRDELVAVIESIELETPRERQNVLNCRATLERLENDAELFQDLLGFFFSDTPKLMADLRQAAATNDADLLRRAAHSLKGLISNFDAKDAAAIAFRLEAMSREDNLEDAAATVDHLATELADVERLLKRFRVQQRKCG